MSLIDNLLNLFGADKASAPTGKEETHHLPVEPDFTTNNTRPGPQYEDPEICIIAERFGELTKGKQIDVTLHELLDILPRVRRRSDAYRPLIRKLGAMGVQLRIVQRAEKTNEEIADIFNKDGNNCVK